MSGSRLPPSAGHIPHLGVKREDIRLYQRHAHKTHYITPNYATSDSIGLDGNGQDAPPPLVGHAPAPECYPAAPSAWVHQASGEKKNEAQA